MHLAFMNTAQERNFGWVFVPLRAQVEGQTDPPTSEACHTEMVNSYPKNNLACSKAPRLTPSQEQAFYIDLAGHE